MSKTAFITGGSSGIGMSICKELRSHGWEIIAPTHAELDLSNLEVVEKYATRLRGQGAPINAFIHSAGTRHNIHEALEDKELETFTAAQITEAMNVGLVSAMVLISGLLPIMRDGVVIGISGTFEDGGAGRLPYYTSKRGLEDFLIGLGQEDYASLRVYGISPADTATEAYKKYPPRNPVTSQTPEAVAEFVLELLGTEHHYANGGIFELWEGHIEAGAHV